MSAVWYNAERVAEKRSVVLEKWIANDPGAAARLGRVPAQVRNETVVSSSDPRIAEIFGAPNQYAGVAVTPESSMRVSAVFAAVRLIAGAIASLPWHIYQRTDAGRQRAQNHPVWWLLNEKPSAKWVSAAMWEYAAGCMLLRGDAIWLIVRNGAGEPVAFIPWSPDRWSRYDYGNERYYSLTDENGNTKGHPPSDIIHLPGFGFDGERSMSVIRWAASRSSGIAIAADQYAESFFSNGAKVQFALKYQGRMKDEAREALRNAWYETYGGSASNFKYPLVLTEGADVKELSLNAVDAQLLESRRFQVEDIARAFGVPAFMIGHTDKTTSWGSGVEQMGLSFIRFTLQPHLVRWEQELNAKLWPRSTRYFVEANREALLEGDSKAQSDYLRQAMGGSQGPGWMTVNEVRRLKNLPPLAGGDVLYNPASTAGAPSA